MPISCFRRCLTSFTAKGDRSMPTHCLPRRSAATKVVPSVDGSIVLWIDALVLLERTDDHGTVATETDVLSPRVRVNRTEGILMLRRNANSLRRCGTAPSGRLAPG